MVEWIAIAVVAVAALVLMFLQGRGTEARVTELVARLEEQHQRTLRDAMAYVANPAEAPNIIHDHDYQQAALKAQLDALEHERQNPDPPDEPDPFMTDSFGKKYEVLTR